MKKNKHAGCKMDGRPCLGSGTLGGGGDRLLHTACQPMTEVRKTHHREPGPEPQLNMGGHQHKVSKQMALHDVIAICCASRGKGSITGTFLLKDNIMGDVTAFEGGQRKQR